MAGKTGRSGGSRPGAGRPRKVKTVSARTKNNYIRAARKLAKEKGMTFEEYMLRVAWDADTQDSVKASIMKAYNEALIAKETESNINVTKKDDGPAIMLPPMDEDPALKVVKGGKKG